MSNNKITKKDNNKDKNWEQFILAFWIILFLKLYIQQASSITFANIGNIFISIILGILVAYYAFKVTKKKKFILLGLTGISTAFSIFAFIVIWKLRSNKIKIKPSN